jgi:hypothetical protein
VDSQRLRRPREPRGDRLSAPLNAVVSERCVGAITIAESTAWPGCHARSRAVWVSLTVEHGLDATHSATSRTTQSTFWHHNDMTFGLLYAFAGTSCCRCRDGDLRKRSLIGKMPGDNWQRFANLPDLSRLHVGSSGKAAFMVVRYRSTSGATMMSGLGGTQRSVAAQASSAWCVISPAVCHRAGAASRDASRQAFAGSWATTGKTPCSHSALRR